MKLRIPPNCLEISHQGRTITIGEDGSLEAPEELLPDLMSHGVTPWDAAEAKPKPVTKRRASLFAQVVQRHRKACEVSTEDVGMIEAPMAHDDLSNSSPKPAPLDVVAVNPEALNRRALFAFLREHGIPVSLPITNEELRALVRRALGR
ncbi:hypothetical protein CU048_04545 [Beijerinckiaceae bacterium]|nr:hypothetical protein CU048_04545 [Beijerinckiaceae bacterium]